MSDKKEYTGVWIPRHVMEDQDLSSQEKILFADIASFNQCFKLNSTFAEQFGVSVPTIQRWLRKLKKKGYVIEAGFDGRKRYLQAYHICNPRGIKYDTPEVSEVTPIDNNIDTNDTSETSVSQVSVLPIEVVPDTPPKKKLKTPDIPRQVFDVFSDVIGRNPLNWRTNKTQRQCAENLYTERGLDQIRKALEGYVEVRGEKFCPTINSPYDLDSKWSNLYQFIKKQE